VQAESSSPQNKENEMPPHCDAKDGPVVVAAREALEVGDVEFVLAYVPQEAEAEVREAFDLARTARTEGAAALRLAELYFFETVVRLHRSGEGAPYTGLVPEGLDHGPIIPLAKEAVETGRPEPLLDALHHTLEREIVHRMAEVTRLGRDARKDLPSARRHVQALLGFQAWSNNVYQALCAPPHEHGAHVEGHEDKAA
jgi:hypothetical protein